MYSYAKNCSFSPIPFGRVCSCELVSILIFSSIDNVVFPSNDDDDENLVFRNTVILCLIMVVMMKI